MKNFKKKLTAICLSAMLTVPVLGSALPKNPVQPEPGISACSLPSRPPYDSVLPDDIEIHD